MKKKSIIALGLTAALLAGGITMVPPNTSYARELAANQTLIDFEDRGSDAQGLTGKYEGCNFGNMGWNTQGAAGNVALWADSLSQDGQVNKIAIPYGKILRGFSAACTGTATVKVIAGSENNTFEIGNSWAEYTTDFSNNEMAVYLVIESSDGISNVKFDDLILEDVDITKQNISQNKSVSTSEDSQYPAGNGNDGSYDTMWVNNGGGADKWWQVDLGSAYTLSDFELTFEKEENNPWKYKIEGSNDGISFDMLADKTQNEDGAMTQAGSITSDVAYRYVRVTITGLPADTYWCGFREFKVFTTDMLSNVALGKTTEQSDGYNASSLAVDGDAATFSGNTGTFPYWWTVDLGSSFNVKEVEIEWENLSDGEKDIAEDWKYKIEYSNDSGATWTDLTDYTQGSPYTDPATSVIQNQETDIECNMFKVTITGTPTDRPLAWAILPEFRAYAVDTSVPEEEGQQVNIDMAYGQPVSASSSADGYAPSNTTDYDASTSWKPGNAGENACLQIDLDREYIIKNHTVDFASGASAYKFLVSSDGESWTELADVSAQDAGSRLDVNETVAKYVRYEFASPSVNLEVQEIHFDGLDAGIKSGKKILVLAPHEDDEMLMAGGVIKRAVEVGDDVKVLLATNGDYNGEASGKGRIVETINALAALGLSSDNIIFLGYADTGGLGGAQTYQDSFIYKLYTAEDDEILTSRWDNQHTYGNEGVKQDYHFEQTGEHATYTRSNFLSDLETAISSYMPTDIYVPSRYDMHFDHAYLDLFAIEAIQNVQDASADYNPTLHESIIHSCAGDSIWPTVNSDEDGILALTMPAGLEDLTMFKWNERENVNVPYAMRQTPFAYNLKDQALRLYTSQYYDYIGSFAKVNEIFWTRDFSSIARYATVTASSENATGDKATDQSAIKAVDGVLDGEASGLPYDHPRYPHAEWATKGETAGAWINLEFDQAKDITKITLYDRPGTENQITGGKLVFDDGSEVEVGELPNNGSPLEIELKKQSKSVKFVVTSVSESTTSAGLAEIAVCGTDAGKGGVQENYQVNYDVNGGSPNTIEPKTDVAWEDASLLPATEPTRDGYTFKGWIYQDQTVDSNTRYCDLAADENVEAITLAAQWEKSDEGDPGDDGGNTGNEGAGGSGGNAGTTGNGNNASQGTKPGDVQIIGTKNAASTGDTANIPAIAITMGAALAILAGIIIYKKRLRR